MKEQEKTTLFDLFKTFFAIGGLTFGGGMAMLPILERECVEKRRWATEEEMLDYFAVGQCTPGIIAVNTATIIGCKKRGPIGGIIATLGIITPGFLIILLLASFLTRFADNPVFVRAFEGVRIAVIAIILNAIYNLGKKAVVDIPTACIMLLSILLQLIFGISPVIIILSVIAFGIIVWRVSK